MNCDPTMYAEPGWRVERSALAAQQQSQPNPSGTRSESFSQTNGRSPTTTSRTGLNMMPLRILGPERHRGLKRRTARKAAREFRDQDARCFGELKTLARPRSHPFQCFVVLRALCQRAV